MCRGSECNPNYLHEMADFRAKTYRFGMAGLRAQAMGALHRSHWHWRTAHPILSPDMLRGRRNLDPVARNRRNGIYFMRQACSAPHGLVITLQVSRNHSQEELGMGTGSARGYVDMTCREVPDHEVRFASGKSIYVETLLEDRWVGRDWSTSGHISFPGTGSTEEAFQLGIGHKVLSTGWKWGSASELPSTDRGARHFAVELSNTACPVKVRIHTLLDGTPVLTRWLEIENASKESLPLTSVFPWSGELWREDRWLEEQAFTLGYFTSADWACEGWFEWKPIPESKPLPDGKTRITCDKGQGHNDPFFIVRNEVKGEYFIGHLAWSANWQMEFERRGDPSSRSTSLVFRIGPWASSPQRVIAPGETIRTPAVHLGHVEGDLDSTVQAMHDHIRGFVLPPRKPERSCLVQLLVPGDQGYFVGDAFNEVNIRKCVDVAAALGAEVFTLDAWWWDVTGDWYPSSARFPHGLGSVREYVRKKGLLFGLYVEAEGGRGPIERSKIGREHPDWLGPKGVLNLTKAEVAEWMEAEIARIIEEYRPDLYRLDYNPLFTFEGPETDRDGFMENNYWRYYEAFYGIYERIQRKYPDVILQQCAAGGARNDLGTASRFHETYLTDGLWMPHALRVYSGQTLALPPEALVVAIGAPGWKGPLDTYLRSTFTLSTPLIAFGPAPSVEELNPQVREAFLRYARVYKEVIRPLLPACRMYHHAPVSARGGVTSSGWFAMEFTSPDRSRGWATIVRTGASESDTYLFVPRGLDPAKTYRLTFDSMNATATADGLRLVRDGLSIRLEAILSSELLLFEAQ